MKWLNKLLNRDKRLAKSKGSAFVISSAMDDIREAGSVDGEHYTGSVERVKQLKREGKNQEAIEILLRCVDATEAESQFAGKDWVVAPWYYEQLAILYRKEKLHQAEVSILERYASQAKRAGMGSEKLAERLLKAKDLIAKHGV